MLPPLLSRYIDHRHKHPKAYPTKVVAFERGLDSGVSIMCASPNWLSCALSGGVLPPIEAYLIDRARRENWENNNPGIQFDWRNIGGAIHPYSPPIGPMTEDEALAYLIMKNIDRRIWASNSNKEKVKILDIGHLKKVNRSEIFFEDVL